jgi:hypothetical protein
MRSRQSRTNRCDGGRIAMAGALAVAVPGVREFAPNAGLPSGLVVLIVTVIIKEVLFRKSSSLGEKWKPAVKTDA